MKYNLIIILSLITLLINAQEVKKDSIGTEEVNVVKPYTPKIKDAFKIKVSPIQEGDVIYVKNPVKYAIDSAPVASTFIPAKGTAKGVAKKYKEQLFDNYLSLGFGNYTTPKTELFINTSSTRDNNFGLLLNYHSSDNGVDNTVLDTDFLDTKIDLFYKESTRDFDWKINGGYHFQKYNWYGLSKLTQFPLSVDQIDSKQTYNNINLSSDLTYYESFFKNANVNINLFTDDYNSIEIHFLATPKFTIPISSELIETSFRLEYINTEFDRSYFFTDNKLKSGFFNLGVSPSLKVLRDDLTLNLGVNLVYSGATEGDQKSTIFIYPNITASYELILDVMTVYAGITGDLQQHSYRNFVSKNPFVSPTLNIGRTNEQYNAKVGAKGKLASNISYNVNASFKNEEGKALFKLNDDFSHIAPENYQYANSFGVVYDNINTFDVFGEIAIDFSKELNFGANLKFSSYDTEAQKEAWNLPELEASVFGKYHLDKWFAGANLFFVGDRKDQYNSSFGTIPTQTEITNKSYVDLNLNFGYNFTNRLTAYANANNVLDSDYKKYTNFQVQGIQFLAGIKYKFNF
jgi:outer membrane receptor protein involved in Fe transport